MDGTTVDYVIIPIVAVICLATWLTTVYWADAHPRKRLRTGQVQQVDVPRQATAPPEDQGNGRGQVPASSARRGTS